MHIQVVNFNLVDTTHEDFAKLCDQLAPAFAEVPGLISKIWLADPQANTYGGVYTWRDREAMEAFAQSSLFNDVLTHPNLADITAKDFGVLEGPTRVTHGLAETVV